MKAPTKLAKWLVVLVAFSVLSIALVGIAYLPWATMPKLVAVVYLMSMLVLLCLLFLWVVVVISAGEWVER